MDKNELLAEIAKETGIILGNDDPIIATAYLNKILLAAYVKDLDTSLEQTLLKISAKEKETFDKFLQLLTERDQEITERIEKATQHFAVSIDKQIAAKEPTVNHQPKTNFTVLIIALLSGVLIGAGAAVYLI